MVSLDLLIDLHSYAWLPELSIGMYQLTLPPWFHTAGYMIAGTARGSLPSSDIVALCVCVGVCVCVDSRVLIASCCGYGDIHGHHVLATSTTDRNGDMP